MLYETYSPNLNIKSSSWIVTREGEPIPLFSQYQTPQMITSGFGHLSWGEIRGLWDRPPYISISAIF